MEDVAFSTKSTNPPWVFFKFFFSCASGTTSRKSSPTSTWPFQMKLGQICTLAALISLALILMHDVPKWSDTL